MGLISLPGSYGAAGFAKISLLGNSQAPSDMYTTEGRSAGDPLCLLQVHWFGHGKKPL